MTTEPMLDRRLRELMAELAAPGDQSAAIDHVLSVTRELRPEPRWRVLLKERPMRTSSVLVSGSPPLRLGFVFAIIALIALLAAAVAVGALVLRQPVVPPAYGPAGNGMLAFAASGDIVTTDATGANRTSITTGPAVDRRPTFSRDGTRIAFVREISANAQQVMVANADGSGLVAVSPELVGVQAFDWSPTGDRLAVLGDSTCCPVAAIFIVAADGGESTEPIDVGDLIPNAWLGWRPPHGDELLFRAHPTAGSLAAGLYSVDPAGGAPRTLLEPVEAVPSDVAAVDAVSLSPDGRWATFWTWGPNDQGVVNGWGHVLDLDARRARIATTWGGSTSPITPDGRWVIGAGNGRLEIEPIDGSAASRPIGPELEMSGLDVAISPDGTQILAIESSGARTLIDIESGAATSLDVAADDSVSWQRVALH